MGAIMVLRGAVICHRVLSVAHPGNLFQTQVRVQWVAARPVRLVAGLRARSAAAVPRLAEDALLGAAVEAVHLAADAAKANVAIKSYKNRRKQL